MGVGGTATLIAVKVAMEVSFARVRRRLMEGDEADDSYLMSREAVRRSGGKGARSFSVVRRADVEGFGSAGQSVNAREQTLNPTIDRYS